MRGRVLVCLLACSLAAAGAAAGGGGPGQDDPAQGYGPNVRYARALGYCQVFHGVARMRSCLIRQLLTLVVDSKDPASELPRIDRYLARTGGYAEANCHVMMHTVGRRYGQIAHVTLARLRDYLPRTNDANCSAGFGHGLLTYLGPQLATEPPRKAVRQCYRVATRYQRYSCVHGFGHAYMRLYAEQIPIALDFCRQMGPENAADCAAGAFHDYWIAVAGLDGTKAPPDVILDPRILCSRLAWGFVRGCWYRALLERPPAQPVRTASDVRRLCDGLAGIEEAGCVTAASVTSSSDPFAQMELCADLRDGEAADCVRGVRAPELGRSPSQQQVQLIQRCAALVRSAQHGCYQWLGMALNVVADGRFAGRCAALRYTATRAACRSGAGRYEGPLETFS